VITLDVEMPKMDGLTFLGKLMRGHPMSVVMVSSLTEVGSVTTLWAMELGAVDFINKPKNDLREGMEEVAQDLIAKVKAAAQAKVRGKGKGERRKWDSRTPDTRSCHDQDDGYDYCDWRLHGRHGGGEGFADRSATEYAVDLDHTAHAGDLPPLTQVGSGVRISTDERRGHGTHTIYGGRDHLPSTNRGD